MKLINEYKTVPPKPSNEGGDTAAATAAAAPPPAEGEEAPVYVDYMYVRKDWMVSYIYAITVPFSFLLQGNCGSGQGIGNTVITLTFNFFAIQLAN